MQRTTLGRTGISVSALCLGSMTWGSRQNDEADGHAQIDLALDHGIDFIDTAEMYPVNPVSAETAGDTEAIIGRWIEKTGRRGEIVLATKVAGPGRIVRPGQPVTPETVTEALDGSLRRLRTDYIDLYQLHWPNRGSYHFRQMWSFDPSKQDAEAERDMMRAVMARLGEFVKQGKIRAFGLSNESAWGTMQWLEAAEEAGGPRIASIQNEYSLLCRIFDTDLAEVGCHEDVTLLAFSPLAAGLLTGKYQDGRVPPGSRMTLSETLGDRATTRVFPAIGAYLDIARRHGLDPAQMAIAWCRTRPFPTIPIFGATSEAQLRTAIGAGDLRLDDAVLAEIDAAHRAHPAPY